MDTTTETTVGGDGEVENLGVLGGVLLRLDLGEELCRLASAMNEYAETCIELVCSACPRSLWGDDGIVW